MAANTSHDGTSQKMAGSYTTDLFFEKATEWMDAHHQVKTPSSFIFHPNPLRPFQRGFE